MSETGGLSRRSLLGAAVTSVVAGSTVARLAQRAGVDGRGRAGGLSLVVAQHEVRVDRTPLAEVRDAGAAGALEPFVAVGLSVPGSLPPASRAAIAVRSHGDDGWTGWLPAPFAPHEAPDDEGGARLVSQPIFVGFGDAVEVELPAGVAGDAEVAFVRETPRVLGYHDTSDPAFESRALRPAIIERSTWNARDPKEPYDFADRLHMAVVHHSVSPNDYSKGEVAGVLAAIQAYHMDANGWNDIAYNFVVDRFGRIWEGRGGGATRLAVGGHAYAHNTGTTGMVLLGTHHRDAAHDGVAPSRQAFDALARLAAWKLGYHGVDAASTTRYTSGTDVTGTYARVIGHRDVRATACPGNLVYPDMKALRALVVEIQQGFEDVPETAYYAEAVLWAAVKGITTGVGGTRLFKPDDAVTRAQMAAFLWRLMDRPTGYPPHPFPDVPSDSYYEDAVRYLTWTGVTTGVGDTGRYEPDEEVTRAQMAAFLHRIAGRRNPGQRHPFPDVPAAAYYDEAVSWAFEHGITTGVGDTGLYVPDDVVTRGQMAAFLFRLASVRDAWSSRVPPPSTVRF